MPRCLGVLAVRRHLSTHMRAALVACALGACAGQAAPAPTPRAPASLHAPEELAAVHGNVVDASGRPAAEALVAFLSSSVAWAGDGPLAVLATCDASGAFRVPKLAPGSYRVTACAARSACANGGSLEISRAAQTDAVNIRLEEGGFAVQGTVRDAAGAPFGGARVEALEIHPDDAYPAYAALADAAGNYRIRLRPGMPYLLVATAAGRARTYQRVEPHEQALDLSFAGPTTPRPSDAVLRAWLAASAIPLTTDAPDGPRDELAPLAALMGDAHLVALGEATHGSAEIFRMKERVFEFLAERLGFTLLGFEAGFAESLAVDAFIHGGPGDAEAVVRGLVTDPYATEEIVALVRALRRYNDGHAAKLSFAGFDATTFTSVNALTSYLERAGLADATLGPALAPLAPIDADGSYAAQPLEVRAAARAAIDRSIAWLDAERDRLGAKLGADAWRLARRHAAIVDQAERIFLDPTVRDALMAANVDALLADNPGARVALWLHSAHASLWPHGFTDMGRRLRAVHGRDYFVLGSAFGSGEVRALGAGRVDAGPTTHRVAHPVPEGFDAALGLAGRPFFALDLRRAPRDVRAWLESPIPAWSIGFMFSDELDAAPRIAPGLAFDAVVYIDKVTAAHGLARRAAEAR